MKRIAEPVARVLLQRNVCKHENKDVRVYAASCFAYMLKMYAPDPEGIEEIRPFSEKDHQDIFLVITWTIGFLDTPSGVFFNVAFQILEVMREVKFYLLPIDLGCPSLIHGLLEIFFKSISTRNFDEVGAAMEEMLVTIFQTAEDIPSQWVHALLMPLVQERSDEAPVRLSQSVLGKISNLLKKPVQDFVLGTFSRFLSTKTGIAPWCQKLAQKLGSVCPEAMSSLIPHFVENLNDRSPAVRMETVDIVGRLFSEPGGAFSKPETEHLIRQFSIKRFIDVQVDIRVKALTFFPRIVCQTDDQGLQREIIKCACRGLHDRDDKVRSVTAVGVCHIASEFLGAVDVEVLKDALLRLKDIKPGVRKAVAQAVTIMIQKLMERDDQSSDSEKKALAFGALVEVCGDPNCQKAFHLGINQGGLMPKTKSHESCAHAWVQLFQEINDHQALLFLRLLKNKATLQASIRSLLEIILPGNSEHDNGQDQSLRIKSQVGYISKQCPNPAKAMENLDKLVQARDRGIFPLMEQHFGLTLPDQDSDASRKALFARVGSKSSLGEFLKLLSAIARPTLISPDHLAGLIKMIHFRRGGYAGEDRPCALMLLQDVAKRAPILYATLGQDLVECLLNCEDDLKHALVYVVSKSAGGILKWCSRNNKPVIVADLMKIMRSMSTSSWPKLAKFGVVALNHMLPPSSAKQELNKIACGISARLEEEEFLEDANTTASLQVLGSIGRVQPEVFSKHANRFVEFLFKSYLPAPLSASEEAILHGLPCSPDVALKCQALRAFSKGCVPDSSDRLPKNTVTAAKYFFAFIEEHRFLDFEQDHSNFGIHTDEDLANFRLASTFSILRMCQNPLLESELPNKLYQDLAMMVQDTDLSVREKVSFKLKKQLHFCYKRISSAPQRPARYAACLALAGIDPIPERRNFAKDCIVEFTQTLRDCVKKANETAQNKQPEFVLPFLIYLVAQHDDVVDILCQSEDEDEDEGITNVLTGFQHVLMMGIEPILLDPGLPDGPFSNYHTIRSTIAALMKTKDKEDEGATHRTVAVCDMALALLDGTMRANGEDISSKEEKHIRPAVPKRFFKWNKSKSQWPMVGQNLPKKFALIEIEPSNHAAGGKKRQAHTKRVPSKRKVVSGAEVVKEKHEKRRGSKKVFERKQEGRLCESDNDMESNEDDQENTECEDAMI